ncbi:hypothetical protein A3Q56_03536 [Intoshia linei]|uniref:PiggyBac transposable element-derived protein domain-containing protein n=2 Tax=Intoshia linei TaxID=1819745 RepID=A0A177B5K9_9BILA|nr:hypothetical protein A3Q56_03536 [Intoshia linei]
MDNLFQDDVDDDFDEFSGIESDEEYISEHMTETDESISYTNCTFIGKDGESECSLRGSRTNVRDIWSNDGCSIDAIRNVLSYTRLLFLSRCIRFDNIHTREERRKFDKLAAIRKVFEYFVKNFRNNYEPKKNLTLNKTNLIMG